MPLIGGGGIPRLRARGGFRRLRAAGDDRNHFFSFPSKEKKRFRASKEEKGACCDIVPQNSQTELSAQCAGSAGARFLKLADTCYAHCSNKRPAGVGSHRGIVRFSHNVRGRHHARRNVVPPGRRHIAVSVQLRRNSVPNGERRLWLYKTFPLKRDSKTVGFGELLVTFRSCEK